MRDLATGATRPVSLDPMFPGVGVGPHYTPDGLSLLFESSPHSGTGSSQLVIAPLDGSTPARPLGQRVLVPGP